MPKLHARDDEERIRQVFFGWRIFEPKGADLARLLGVSQSTGLVFKKNPGKMSLKNAIIVANASGMPDEEWVKLRHQVKGRK